MYLTKLEITAIRSMEHFKFEVPKGQPWGWHVLLGDNGAGKSSFVRSLALALAGPTEAQALRQDWTNWLRRGRQEASIAAHVIRDAELDQFTGSGRRPTDSIISEISITASTDPLSTGAVIAPGTRCSRGVDRALWGRGKGWFSASFGPYRRFTGGNRDYERIFLTNPRLAPHLSAFGEDVALTECLEWLRNLHVERLESTGESSFLEDITRFINEGGLLPHGARLVRITSKEITFTDGNGSMIGVDQLSDGYRSILSLTFELIRQLAVTFGHEAVTRRIRKGEMTIDLPGVVAIDEIDAHLHPTWQRRIGPWFLQFFPRMQFLVTTHSPIICQAAEHGSVWRLPTPGTSESGGKVEGEALSRLIFGNILEAYDTAYFGDRSTRSASSREMLKELANLNRKLLTGTISPQEQARLDRLRAAMPSTATVAERTNLAVE